MRKECRSPGAIAFAGSSIISRWAPPLFVKGLDPDTTEGAIDLVYTLPNLHVEYLRVNLREFRRRSGAASGRRTMSS
jgi:hypothetical protein